MDLIKVITPLIGIVARERTREQPYLYDDARQEGLIRAWTVLTERPDAPREYVVAAAKRGVGDVVRGRPAFGAASHRGRQDAHDLAGPLVRLVDGGGEELVIDPEDPSAQDAYDAADVAGLVRRSVAELADPIDRLMVYERFWGDRLYADIGKDVGLTKQALERRWANHVRPALRERLQHHIAA